MSETRRVQQLFDLSGRTALVTGGSRGLGLQMAHALGEAGARVLISSRKAGELEEAVAELKAAGIDAQFFAADGGNPEAITGLADTAISRLGGQVDILVNNAGATWGAPAEDHPLDAWDKVMNLNVRGLFLLSQAIAKKSMLPRKSGRIVNIASIAALGGAEGMRASAYHASKGAVFSFTRALAVEWGRHGIAVNAIAPGVFPSKMSKKMIADAGEEGIAKNLPLRRIGNDEALKGTVLLLASDAGQFITGQMIAVDGGASAVVV